MFVPVLFIIIIWIRYGEEQSLTGILFSCYFSYSKRRPPLAVATTNHVLAPPGGPHPYTRYTNRLNPGNNRGIRIVPLPPSDANVLCYSLNLNLIILMSLWRPMPFCYECGRSLNVTLTPCGQCKEVLLCSKACQLKHKPDCDNLIAG